MALFRNRDQTNILDWKASDEAEVLTYTRMQLFTKGINMYLKSTSSGMGRHVVWYFYLQGLRVSIELCLLLVSGLAWFTLRI
jgi:hypothetical protein